MYRGVAVSVGGPMATAWVVPSEEELRSRYNPDLLKRSLEGREERQAEFNEFVTKLKAYSKSDKPSGFISFFLILIMPAIVSRMNFELTGNAPHNSLDSN